MKPDKPLAMIIDEVIASPRPPWLDRKAMEELAIAAQRADRFVFSQSASKLIGQFVMECPDLVLQHRQFAIPPFDTMYVEFQGSFFEKFPIDPLTGRNGTDTALGYLVNGKRVYVVSRSANKPRDQVVPGDRLDSFIVPMYYTWVAPGNTAPMDADNRGRPIVLLGEHGEWNRLVVIAGQGVHKINNEEMRQGLLNEVQPHIMTGYSNLISDPSRLSSAINSILQSTAGDMRNLWAALLWLNRPVHTTITNQPAGRRFFHGKQVAYKAHRIVEVDLHKHRSIRRAFVLSGERLSPRRHKVRGAFHHKGGQFACSHDWPLEPDVDGHWKCTRCGRLRWWMKDHVRGDATRGFVTHDYSVST